MAFFEAMILISRAEFITTVKSSIAFNKIEHLFQLLPEDHYIASGYPELDIALGGGFPKKKCYTH